MTPLYLIIAGTCIFAALLVWAYCIASGNADARTEAQQRQRQASAHRPEGIGGGVNIHAQPNSTISE